MAGKIQTFIEARQKRFTEEYNTLNLDTFMDWFSERYHGNESWRGGPEKGQTNSNSPILQGSGALDWTKD